MKKEHTWGTPKKVILAETEVPRKVRWRSKRLFPCKKLKGEHQFKLVKEETFKWFQANKPQKTIFQTYECEGCGKKDLKVKR